MVRSVSKNRIIRNIFNKITPLYEPVEKMIYFGKGAKWRQMMVDACPLEKPRRLLDACCGTGKLSVMLARRFAAPCHIVGIDFSPTMVNSAKEYARQQHLQRRIEVKTENIEIMPFPERFFDGVFISFGLRFASDIKTVLKECYRVLQPGGSLIILELARPSNPIVKMFAHIKREYYFPLWARFRFGMPSSIAYHMHDSLVHYPDADKLGRMLIRAGFDEVEYQEISGGVATMHRAFKPGTEM